jgi:hypothetical protein
MAVFEPVDQVGDWPDFRGCPSLAGPPSSRIAITRRPRLTRAQKLALTEYFAVALPAIDVHNADVLAPTLTVNVASVYSVVQADPHGPGSLLAVWSRPGISVFPARAGAALSHPQGARASASVGRLRPRAGTTQRQTRAPHGPAARADWLTAVSGHVHEPAERGRKRHGIRQPARQRPAR